MAAPGRLRVLVLLAASLFGGSVLSAQTGPADSLKIQQLARQFSAAFMRGDAAAMAEIYTSDGVIFPEQSE